MSYDFFLILFSYICGSIPFGLLISYVFKTNDPRNIGSKNIGATNVLRTGNKLLGYSTLVLDVLKAIIPLLIIEYFFRNLLLISSLCIFLGHVFPVWLRFKGGKGVATLVGIIFCINYYLLIAFIAVWLIIFLFTKYSSLSSITATLSLPIISFFLIENNEYYFFIILFILIFYTHRENIKRLINNTESKTKIY